MIQFLELLEKKANLRLLRHFLNNPTKEVHAARLQREIRLSRKCLFDALSQLEKAGILSTKSIGRMILYSLNNKLTIVKQLKILFALSQLGALSEIFRNTRSELYLFGSMARGENSEQSDIDLLVITELEKGNVTALLAKARIKNLKPVILTSLDYAGLYKRDRAFYERVEKDKIRLI